MTEVNQEISTASLSTRVLRFIGWSGSLLALVILGASIFLRLTTNIGTDGAPISVLAPGDENSIRMLHRLTASSVGVLTLVLAILGWVRRKALPNVVGPIGWVVAATVLLAVIGPLTPGYRLHAVTVANVVAGTILLAAFWCLRERLAQGPTPLAATPPLVRTTLAVLLLHVGLGAAASSYEMRGIHWVAWLHSGSGMLSTLLLGSLLWELRADARLSKFAVLMAGLLLVQVALGVFLLWAGGRPVVLGFVHAMISPLLVAAVVSVAERKSSS